jgi:hypothetical protein
MGVGQDDIKGGKNMTWLSFVRNPAPDDIIRLEPRKDRRLCGTVKVDPTGLTGRHYE